MSSDKTERFVFEHLTQPDLEKIAAVLAGAAHSRDVFALYGDLGAGKSVFARAFVRALTSPDEDVPSPTFTLVQTYDGENKAGEPLTVWHFDLYRLKTADEIYEIGFEEALSDGVSVIEWSERAAKLLPRNRTEITIRPDGDATRTMIVVPMGGAQNKTEVLKSCRNALTA